MNIYQPNLSRRMAKVVQTMPVEIKYAFIEAVKKAPSEKQIAEPFRSYLEKGYKPHKDRKDMEKLDTVTPKFSIEEDED